MEAVPYFLLAELLDAGAEKHFLLGRAHPEAPAGVWELEHRSLHKKLGLHPSAFQVTAGPLAASLTATSDQDYLQHSHSCVLMREEESPVSVGIN